MPIVYVAQTRDHLLMLDEEGVCVRVQRRWENRGDDAADGADCCVGAQYVAALDPREAGYLAPSPTIGVPMLFAKLMPTGKIRVVRTGPLERFEERASGMFERARNVDPTRITRPDLEFDAARRDDEPTGAFRRGELRRTEPPKAPAPRVAWGRMSFPG
jgi:hypothetical protein